MKVFCIEFEIGVFGRAKQLIREDRHHRVFRRRQLGNGVFLTHAFMTGLPCEASGMLANFGRQNNADHAQELSVIGPVTKRVVHGNVRPHIVAIVTGEKKGPIVEPVLVAQGRDPIKHDHSQVLQQRLNRMGGLNVST